MRIAGLAFLICCLAPLPAGSHPHAWIDLTVRVLFDEDGRAAGLRETWLFDDFYTAFAMEGLGQDVDGTPSDEALEIIRRENLANLQEFDYFTKVTVGGESVFLEPATESSATMVGPRLSMSFTVAFDAPRALAGSTLDYAIFDPSYYIEMLHADRFDAIGFEDAPEGCGFELTAPNPTFEAVSLAAALDRTQSGPENMGELFAQTVSVTCP